MVQVAAVNTVVVNMRVASNLHACHAEPEFESAAAALPAMSLLRSNVRLHRKEYIEDSPITVCLSLHKALLNCTLLNVPYTFRHGRVQSCIKALRYTRGQPECWQDPPLLPNSLAELSIPEGAEGGHQSVTPFLNS